MSKIFLVEDDPVLREMLVECLSDFAIDVDTASDGGAALAEYSVGKYKTVISDLFMPNMDGLSFLKKLREQDKNVEVVVVTASTQPEAKAVLDTLGITQLFYKPLSISDIDQLIEIVEN